MSGMGPLPLGSSLDRTEGHRLQGGQRLGIHECSSSLPQGLLARGSDHCGVIGAEMQRWHTQRNTFDFRLLLEEASESRIGRYATDDR